MQRPPYFAALIALSAFFPSGSEANGWSKVKQAPDGPNKLDECPCVEIYTKMVQCQKLKGPNSNIRDCICVPNPDGWYGWMGTCRDCLSNGSDDFFGLMSSTITQLFVSCTNAGGGVTSDGESICASNAMFKLCTGLSTTGEASWSSYESFKGDGEKEYAERVLNITDPEGASKSSSDTATLKTTTSAASDTALPKTTISAASDTAVPNTTPSATSSGVGALNTTTGAPSTTTSLSSSTVLSAERVVGLAIVIGVGAALL